MSISGNSKQMPGDTKSGSKGDKFANQLNPQDLMNFGGMSAKHGFDPSE